VTLGSTEGIYSEPAGATPVAGVRKALREGIIESDQTVVVAATGFGLKDTESARKATGGVERIDPDIAEVRRLYGGAKAAADD
jgi:threonine synthase